MDKEQLRQNEPFFGGYLVYDEISRNDEYTAYRVKKQSPDGRVHYAVLRCYTFECDNEFSGASSYPAKLRRLIADTETMMRLQNCANVVKFYEKNVLPTEYGYEFLTLTQDAMPLLKREKLEMLPKAEAYAIVSAVCEALNSFRSLGITHRKICPENIFVDSTGGYLLGDFGVGGTYVSQEDYISPEEHRVTGDYSAVDVYQTGVLLYKLLNKDRAPFLPAYPTEITDENRRNAFMRRMNGELPSSFEGSTSQEEEIIRKACAFQPSERYRNIATLKSDVDALIRSLAPVGAHDYYANYKPVQNIVNTVKVAQENFDEDEEDLVDDSSAFDERDYTPSYNTADDSSKVMKGLVGAIIAIAVLAAGIIGYAFLSGKNKEPLPTSPAVDPVTQTTETAAPTTETAAPTTESTTAPTTVPTTEPTTLPTTTTLTPTTQATTFPVTEPTTIYTTVTETMSEIQTTQSEQTSDTTKFTLPEGFTWFDSTEPAETKKVTVDTEKSDIIFYEDSGVIDEIIVSIKETFGENIASDGDAVICEYNNGKLMRTIDAPTDCMYDEDTESTLCDVHIPKDFVINAEENNYRIIFPSAMIKGDGYENVEFAVDFNALSFD